MKKITALSTILIFLLFIPACNPFGGNDNDAAIIKEIVVSPTEIYDNQYTRITVRFVNDTGKPLVVEFDTSDGIIDSTVVVTETSPVVVSYKPNPIESVAVEWRDDTIIVILKDLSGEQLDRRQAVVRVYPAP